MLLNLDVRDFDLSLAHILVHCFDLPGLVLTNCDETAWLASQLPHSPATAQITGSSVKLCFPRVNLIAFALYGVRPPFSHVMYYALRKRVYVLLKSKV